MSSLWDKTHASLGLNPNSTLDFDIMHPNVVADLINSVDDACAAESNNVAKEDSLVGCKIFDGREQRLERDEKDDSAVPNGVIISAESASSNVDGDVGIALMRLESVFSAPPPQFAAKRPTSGSLCHLHVFRPSWFPLVDPITGKKMSDLA